MTPITTSDVCACAAIGSSAAVAVAPSSTFRRVMVIRSSFVTGISSMKQSNATVKHESTASLALKNGKLLILEIGDKHQSGRVRDRERQPGRRNHCLRRDAAGPEYGNLIVMDRHRVAVIRLCNVGDADRMRQAEVN